MEEIIHSPLFHLRLSIDFFCHFYLDRDSRKQKTKTNWAEKKMRQQLEVGCSDEAIKF